MAENESLIDNEYLKEHFVEVYLRDAVAQIMYSRAEANKHQTPTPPIKPCKFFKEYFAGVRQGNHVLFREFEFCSATPYNRLSVLTSLIEAYRNHLFKETKHNARDYHSMMQLVFPDFPMQVVQDAFDAYDDEKKEDNSLKFLDFVKALKASFCTGTLDYESDIINTLLDDKLNEITEIFAQGGDAPKNLMEAEYLVNVRDATNRKQPTPLAFMHKILDGSEFKRLLSFNDSNSISSDEPDLISGSSESRKSVTKGKKKGKSKKSPGQSKSATLKKSAEQNKSTTQKKSTDQNKSTIQNKDIDYNNDIDQSKGITEIEVSLKGIQTKSITEIKISQNKVIKSKIGIAQYKRGANTTVSEGKKSSGQDKNKGKLGRKLSSSLNVLQSSKSSTGQDADDKKPKHRSRSRSVTAEQRSDSRGHWRSHSGSSESSLSL